MKKSYEKPEMQILSISEKDIVTGSAPETDIDTQSLWE